MWHACSPAPGPTDISGCGLRTIWDVDADASYDVTRKGGQGTPLIALRTLAGKGRIDLEGQGALDAVGKTLVVMEAQVIRRYRCLAKSWRFWWFEFSMSGPLPFSLHRLMRVPARKGDEADFRMAFSELRREVFARRCVASAIFTAMLYRWTAGWESTRRRGPHQDAVGRVIDRMHENLDGRWTVLEMAQEAHLSVRRFRQVFRAATGQSPKRFYDRLRLNMAENLLRLGRYNVSEISERLGYSSPFHFSKAFREHRGCPPSRIR